MLTTFYHWHHVWGEYAHLGLLFFKGKLIWYLLPSASKLRRLCFYRRLSIQWGGGCLVPGGCLVLGVSAPGGGGVCLVLGGAWSRGWGGVGVSDPGGVGIPACTEADPPGRDGYCCGRYASYWNAFLLVLRRYFRVRVSACVNHHQHHSTL